MYNKDTSKKRLYQILEMPVNADTIKSTGRVTSSRITGSSFLSLYNAMELYTSFMDRTYGSSIENKERRINMIKDYLKWYFKNVIPLFVWTLSIMLIAYYLCTGVINTLNF